MELLPLPPIATTQTLRFAAFPNLAAAIAANHPIKYVQPAALLLELEQQQLLLLVVQPLVSFAADSPIYADYA